MSDTLLSISQAAKKLGVAAVTLRLWERQGKIKSLRTDGNQRRYSSAMLDEFLNKSKIQNSNNQINSNVQNFKPQELTSNFHHQILSMPLLASVQKQILVWTLTVIALAGGGAGIYKYSGGNGEGVNKILGWFKGPLASKIENLGSGSVLAAETINDDYRFVVNVPALFNKNITAPNIIYKLTAGDNVTITGGQNPTISANDQTTNLKIFKTVKVGSTEISAGSKTDTLELVAGSNITLSTSDKKITIANSYSAPDTGWTLSGGISSTTKLASIGAASGAARLNLNVDDDTDLFTASKSGSLVAKLNANGIWTTSGVLPLAHNTYNLGSSTAQWNRLYVDTIYVNNGIVSWLQRNSGAVAPSNITDDLLIGGISTASATLRISSAGVITTGTWNGVKISEIYGGTNQSSYTTGDLLYSSATNTLSKLGVGSTGQVLTVTGGVPVWAGGLGGTGTVGYWQRSAGGVLAPDSITDDLAIGGTSTASAKFQVFGNNGNIVTAGTLTLPNSNSLTGQAGNIQLSGGVSVGGGTTYYVNTSGNANFNTLNAATTTLGGTTVTSLLNSGSASVSGGLILYGVTTVSTTNMQSLNLGDSSTGNIVTSKNISATGTLTGLTGLTVASGTVSLPSGQIDNAELAGSIAASKLIGTDIATVGTITTGTWNGTKVSEVYGGTNQSTYTTGDILYSSATNTLSKLGIGSSTQVLTVSGGVPAWTNNTSIGNWQRNSGTVSPLNITDDVLVGGISTAAATLRISAAGVITLPNSNTLTGVSGYTQLSGGVSVGGGTTYYINNLGTANLNGLTAGTTSLGGTTVTSLTDTGSATISGALTLYTTPTIATSSKQTLTLGDSNTGNVVVTNNLSAANLSGTNTGDQTITLTGDVTGSGTGSFATTIGALKVTNAMLAGSIAPSKLLTVTEGYGGTNQTTYTTGDILYASGTNTLAKLGIGSANQVLSVVAGIPGWVASGAVGTNYWNVSAGALFPLSSTADLLVGGQSTASAKFAFINVSSGTPTASVSGNLVLDAAGVISTTKKQTLTIGDSSTGNIAFGQTITSGTWNGTAIGATYGGTGQTTWTTGDLPYASATNTVSKLAVGSTNQVLIVSGGVPTWGSVPGSSCVDCILNDPGGTQTITPTVSTGTGLRVAQASGGTVDVFSVTNNGSTTKYFAIDSSGNATASGNLTFDSAVTLATTRNQAFTISNPLTTNTINLQTISSAANFTGTLTTAGILTANSSATISGNLALFGTPTIVTANKQSLTLGDSNTGNIAIANPAVLSSTLTLPNSNTFTGVSGYAQASAGISVGGGTTYYINNLGTANLNGLTAGTTSLGATTVTSLTDTGSASVSGALTLYTTPTIATTAMQSLTLGDSNTGNIVTSKNISATGTLTGLTGLTVASGTVSLPAGQIDNAELAGSITASKLVGTDIATVGTITSGTWNGTAIGAIYGGTGQTTWTIGDILYASGTNTLAKLAIGSSSQVLTVSGGVPVWGAGASSSNWQRNSGAIAPLNITDDLLVGGISTASAKLSVISGSGNLTTAGTITLPNSNTLTGVSGYAQASAGLSVGGGTTYYINNLGTANLNALTVGSTLSVTGATTLTGALTANSTASVSGALTLYGTPTIASTALQSLTLGNSTTGNIILAPTQGNVGIGTTNPNAKLVVGDGTGSQRLAIDGAAASQIDLAFRKAGTVKWLEYMDASSNDLRFNDGADRVTFQSGGNVGIGTTSPLTALQVVGSASASANLSLYGQGTAHTFNVLNAGTLNIQRSVGGDAGLASSMFVDASGNVGIGTTGPISKLDITQDGTTNHGLRIYGTGGGNTPGMYLGMWANSSYIYTNAKYAGSWTTDDATKSSWGMEWGAGVDMLKFRRAPAGSTTFADFMVITNAGNVGIGTTSPLAKLDVNGTASVSGALSLYGTPTIGSTALQTLTLGSSTTGGVSLAPGGTAALTAINGNVGIGTTGPTSLLHLSSASAPKASFTDTTNSRTAYFGVNDGFNAVVDVSAGSVLLKSAGTTWVTVARSGTSTTFDTGNVGIGTTGPGNLLEVKSTATSVNVAKFGSSGANSDVGTLFANDAQMWGLYVRGGGTDADNFNIENANTGARIMTFLTTGNVGIGTTGPDAKLDSLATSGEQLRLTYTDGSVFTGFTVDSSGNLVVNNSGTYTSFSDKVSVGTTSSSDNLNVAGAATVSASLALGPQSADPATCNAANEGRVYYKGTTGTKRLYLCDGTSWVPISAGTLLGGPSYNTISPEFPGAVISADGSNNIGTLTSDREATGSGSLYSFNYYEFSSGQTTLQDYDIYLRWELPENFSSWATSNAITIDYATEDTSSANNKIDVQITKENDADTVTSSSNVSPTAGKWQSSILSSSPISFTSANLTSAITWAAGDVAVIRIRLFSKDNYFARVGSIKFDWQ